MSYIIQRREVTIGMGSVAVGSNSDGDLVCTFAKNEGTAIITTQIKLSSKIAEHLARLIKMALSEKEFEKQDLELVKVRTKLAQVRGALAFLAKLKKSDCEYGGELKKQWLLGYKLASQGNHYF